MRNIIIVLITIFIFSIVFVRPAIGQESAGDSARLDSIIINRSTNSDKKTYNFAVVKLTIKSILEQKYNSALADQSEAFTTACKKYELNCFLLPAIAGLESTFGKFLMPGSYNPFGWGGGNIYFNSWEEGINTVGRGLYEKYIKKLNTDTLEKIGSIYSESPTWTPRVASFINIFEKEYEKNLLYLPTE